MPVILPDNKIRELKLKYDIYFSNEVFKLIQLFYFNHTLSLKEIMTKTKKARSSIVEQLKPLVEFSIIERKIENSRASYTFKKNGLLKMIKHSNEISKIEFENLMLASYNLYTIYAFADIKYDRKKSNFDLEKKFRDVVVY